MRVMRASKLLVALIGLVLCPLILMGWLGYKVSVGDRARIEKNIRDTLEGRLLDIRATLRRSIRTMEQRVIKALELRVVTKRSLRKLQGETSWIRQSFLVDRTGRLVYPSLGGEGVSRQEQSFLDRTKAIWNQKAILLLPENHRESPLRLPVKNSHTNRSLNTDRSGLGGQQRHVDLQQQRQGKTIGRMSSLRMLLRGYGSGSLRSLSRNRATSRPTKMASRGWGDGILDLAANQAKGWLVWYWAEGLHLLFWKRQDDRSVVGVEVDRVILLSQLISELPATSAKMRGQIQLQDIRGKTLYRWGRYEASRKERPLAQLRLAYPLHTWQLVYRGPELAEGKVLQGQIYLNLGLMVGSLLIVLLGLAFFIYRTYTQEVRLSTQRVSFVTQVSHELKTPLTNIRLYAELLSGRVSETDERAQRHTHVIMEESERLSRLIGNIMAFAKHQRGTPLALRCEMQPIFPAVMRVVEQYRTAFERRGIQIQILGEAAVMCGGTVMFLPYPYPDGLEEGEITNTVDECGLTAEDEAWLRDVHHKEVVGYFDGDAFAQILHNLLGNIEKYALSCTRVRIKVAGHEITVADDGPGIPAEIHDTLFQPYVRGSDKLSDGVTGMGIGLSIARELAQQMGGDLSLVPTTEGATFRYTWRRLSEEK